MLRYERDDRVRITNTGTDTLAKDTLVKVGNWVGVPFEDILPGEEGILMVRGVFDVPVADSSVEIASGTVLQYAGNGKVKPYDESDNTNPKVGKAFKAKASGEETVYITLMPELY
jgi:predicted RecA/RadA family phage recombinase